MTNWYRKLDGSIDAEKVITELELDFERIPDEENHIVGMFDREAVELAVELLKVQESFQPFRSGDYHPDWCCGNCKYPGLYGRMKFCPECGKAVKWND